MRTLFLRRAAIAALVTASAGFVSAQQAPTAASATDRRFVQEAGAGGAAEVALGTMATQRASRSEVRQFGQQMVDDHTRAGAVLKQIATARGMSPPDAPTPAQRKVADRLAQRSGDAFDRSYLNQMVLDHEKTIAVFRREARSGRDPELRAFAAATLPTLDGHLRMVRTLQTKGGPVNRAINEQSASAPR